MAKEKPQIPPKPVKDRTVIKVHSTDPASQGPFVLLERWKFDAKVHKLYDAESHAGSTGEAGDGKPRGKRAK